MTDTPSTVHLEVPQFRVVADLKKMVRHLAEAAMNGLLLQDWGKSVADLWHAAESIGSSRTDGELAWQLLLTGIGEALTEIANEQQLTKIDGTDVDIIVERIGNEAEGLTIPVDFLDHPTNLPPVKLAKTTMLAWLAPPAENPVPHDLINLEHRFNAAFVLGLHRTIRRNEALYRPLLNLRQNPADQAWQELEDWRLYRAWVVSEFQTAPVFDETFAIDRLYVPLNAWHWAEQESAEDDTKSRKFRAVVKLNDDIMAWLRGERGSRRLRLVSGGPGSGKSSAMKALAAGLAENGNDGHPIDVLMFPLQRFQWRNDIVDSVRTTLITYGDQMRHNPLDPEYLRDRQTPLLLIFDGLDELAVTGQVSEAISASFLRQLTSALLNWHERPVRIIVTGRDAIFGNIEGSTTTLPGERFHLLPYHVRENEPGSLARVDYSDPKGLLQTDDREKAFKRFKTAKGQPANKLPEIYGKDNLHDLTAQPLLNYFILASDPDEISDDNLAKIYGDLFQRLHERNRNLQNRPQDEGKPGAGIDQDSFDRAFEAMAVAAWRNGSGRAASWEEILDEVAREDSHTWRGQSRLGEVFGTGRLDPGAQKPFRLAAAFFAINDQDVGIEFTHKSFGDYLYARRLAKEVASMAEALKTSPVAEAGMLHRWEKLTSEQRMSEEVSRFLELQIEATVDAEDLAARHNVLAPVLERVFQEGIEIAGEVNQRGREKRCSQMEEALFVAWHAMWRPDGNRRYWKLGENTEDLLFRALARHVSAHGVRPISVFIRGWSGVDLSGRALNSVNLKGANLMGANLGSADLGGADLRGANLRAADLRRANLMGATLKDAYLIEANLECAQLGAVDLSSADLGNAKLRRASLEGANLENANLEGTDLGGADLRGADLGGADRGGTLDDPWDDGYLDDTDPCC